MPDIDDQAPGSLQSALNSSPENGEDLSDTDETATPSQCTISATSERSGPAPGAAHHTRPLIREGSLYGASQFLANPESISTTHAPPTIPLRSTRPVNISRGRQAILSTPRPASARHSAEPRASSPASSDLSDAPSDYPVNPVPSLSTTTSALNRAERTHLNVPDVDKAGAPAPRRVSTRNKASEQQSSDQPAAPAVQGRGGATKKARGGK